MFAQNDNCPKCGMPVSKGDRPTESGGETFCCQGCAEGGDCTCSQHQH